VNKLIKTTGKLALLALFVLSLLAVSIYFVGNIYKEELKNYVIEEINREINVKIQVGSVNISALRKFPYISVVLADATAWSASGIEKEQFSGINTDTLFYASRIYLQFNLFDIIQKNYRLRKVHAEDGNVNLLADRFGRVNYRLFKAGGKTSQNPVSVNLDGVKISGVKWTYLNLSENTRASGIIKDIAFKGKLASSDHTLAIAGSLLLDDVFRNDIRYADQLNIGLKVNMAVIDTLFKISKGDLVLNNMDFRLTGTFTSGDLFNMDLQVGASGIDIKTFFTSLPVRIKLFERYNPRGKIDFLTHISGIMSRTQVPEIRAEFRLMKVRVFLPEKKLTIEGINLKGLYTNGSMHNSNTSSIKISEYSFTQGRTYLQGNFFIENFNQPNIIARISGSIDAQTLSEISTIPGLKIDQGFIHPEISMSARLRDLKKFHISKIISSGINGKISLDSISGFIPGLNEKIDDITGVIKVEGDTWYPQLRARSKESDIRINIEANHVLGRFLFRNTSLWLKGDLYSHNLYLKRFITSEIRNDTSLFVLPEKLNILFNYATDSLTFGKFRAENVNSNIAYKDGILSISSLEMKTLKGRITANGNLTQRTNGDMVIKSQGILDKIDINAMFYSFNNFTQNFIVTENLRGLISGDIKMSLITDNKFKPFFSSLILGSDFTIIDGELVSFEPILQLSRYISLSELEHIRFSSLHNSILVENSKVYIPKMDIKSSAFNITASGTHDFNNYFEYKVRVNLTEILAGKARKAKKENELFEIIEKDESGTTSIHLAINGTPDNFRVRYDRKEAIIKIRNDIQNEKKTLKAILKDEFGFYRKDSTINLDNNKKTKDQFILDWGDEKDTKSDKDQKQNVPREKKPEFEIEW
jgi:hypothetical protein